MAISRNSNKNVADLTQAELLRYEAKLDEKYSALNQKLIEAGRGREKVSDVFNKTDDLSIKTAEVLTLQRAVIREKERRWKYHGSYQRIRAV